MINSLGINIESNLEILYEKTKGQKAQIILIVETGSIDDGDKSGIAHFLEHMLVEGLNDFSEYSNNEIIVSATTDICFTIYRLVFDNVKRFMKTALIFVNKLIYGQLMTTLNLELVRGDIKKEYILYSSKMDKNPHYVLFQKITNTVSIPIGDIATINSLNFKDIVMFHKENYLRCKKKLVIFSKDNCIKDINLLFGSRRENKEKKRIKNNNKINCKQYCFECKGDYYYAWGNILNLKIELEQIDFIQIALTLICKEVFEEMRGVIEIYSYGKIGTYYVMQLSNKCSYQYIEKMIIEKFTFQLFCKAKQQYLYFQNNNKNTEIEDILFCINNNMNIRNKKKRYDEVDYKKIKILLKKIIGVIDV